MVEQRAQRASSRPGDADALVATLRAAGIVFAEDEADLLREAAEDAATGQDLDALVARRCAGEPLEVVVGWAAFDGLRIPVGPGVFVPRRRTEALVDVAARRLLGGSRGADPVAVVDLCCGTGAVGVALARRLTVAGLVPPRLVLADVDPLATAAARRSATALAVPAEVVTGDLFEPLPGDLRGRVDVLTANVPYVPSRHVALLPSEARDHEPLATLDGGPDGLDVLRRVAGGAAAWLRPGGVLLCEATEAQVPVARESFRAGGLRPDVVRDADHETVVLVGDVATSAPHLRR